MQPRYINQLGQKQTKRVDRERYSLLRQLPLSVPGVGRFNQPPPTATSLAIMENAEWLSRMSLGQAAGPSGPPSVSLIRGFKATIPSSELSKQRRRMIRGGIVDEEIGGDKLGLKQLGDRARGLLTEGGAEAEHNETTKKSRRRRKMRESRRATMAPETKLHLEDLLQQADEIALDKDNLCVRQVWLLLIGPNPRLLFTMRLRTCRQRLISSRTYAAGWRNQCSRSRRRISSSRTSWKVYRS